MSRSCCKHETTSSAFSQAEEDQWTESCADTRLPVEGVLIRSHTSAVTGLLNGMYAINNVTVAAASLLALFQHVSQLAFAFARRLSLQIVTATSIKLFTLHAPSHCIIRHTYVCCVHGKHPVHSSNKLYLVPLCSLVSMQLHGPQGIDE